MLAASLGGSVLTREKNGQIFPESAVYRVTLAALRDPGELSDHSWRGTVVIRGAWEAPGLRFVHAILTVLWREAGF
jgi:putative peptide zinc metalloprotease protein